MCFVFLKIKIYSCSCTAVWIALKMGGLASNWKLSGIPCHFDLVIFFTFFLYFLSDLPPCLHISSLFILLPVYPTCFHFIIAWFLTPSPCCLLLPIHFSLNNYFHMSVWHDRGACKRGLWKMQMSVWHREVQDCSLTYCLSACRLSCTLHWYHCATASWHPRMHPRVLFFQELFVHKILWYWEVLYG